MTQTMIGPNPNTTANAKGELFAAARKGKAAAKAAIRRHQTAGTWSTEVAAAMLDQYDADLANVVDRSVEHFRLAGARAHLIASIA